LLEDSLGYDRIPRFQALGPVGGTKDERGKTMARDLQLKRRLHRALSASPGWLAPLVLLLSVAAVSIAVAAEGKANSATVERWGVFELALSGPSGGNPFVDVKVGAEFRQGYRAFLAEGFYDGEGMYRIRFMPDALGRWTYVTRSDRRELAGKEGAFICIEPSPGNHGPVRVDDTYYFAYADGAPHFSIGTTCYAWVHQGAALEEQTLETLSSAPFNKIRMCVFPKTYTYNANEPKYYPYEGAPLKDWDFKRFNPEFWRHFEGRILDLQKLGIEADIIIFHPYDRWGFKDMGHENNLLYLRYLVARLAAYRNVWWSFANEYDLLKWPMEQWDEYMKLVAEIDPYNHLRGIHNCRAWYDHSKPWVTHCSIQDSNFRTAKEYREKYKKPVVYDECRYEGDIPQGWGNISGEQMTRNFWMGSLAGCYVGHGETYKHPKDILWWSKGGVLHGQSPARIAFMKEIVVNQSPYGQMRPDFSHYPGAYILAKPGEHYLIYFSETSPISYDLPGDRPYKVDGIDTWEMTVTPIGSAGPGRFDYTPTRRDYAVRLTPYKPGEKIRPEAKSAALPVEGVAPLAMQFSTTSKLKCKWDFGDGGGSSQANTSHVYKEPGIYTAKLTVTDEETGISVSDFVSIYVDRVQAADSAIVQVGCKDDNSPTILHGKIGKGEDGSYDFAEGEPWRWISIGQSPIEALEGLRSFTILGWANPTSLKIGSGGNRIAFNLNYSRSGFDLVHLQDGRLRLAVNEWPDGVTNDSSSGKLRAGEWTFFAVTYDSTNSTDNVQWYFGGEDTPARLDRSTSYNRGPTGKGSGTLTIGNYNESIHQHGKDRQFRGWLRGIKIFGSRIGARGALSLGDIRKHQQED